MKYNRCLTLSAVVAGIFALNGCAPPKDAREENNTKADVAAVSSSGAAIASEALETSQAPEVTHPSALLGHWIGVEGTALDIVQKGDHYEITILSLDGPQTFRGKATANGISFVRDNIDLTIQRGDGEATGMKWLADKKDCIVVAEYEGYCRD